MHLSPLHLCRALCASMVYCLVASAPAAAQDIHLFAPARVHAQSRLPVAVVHMDEREAFDRTANYTVHCTAPAASVTLKRGAGTALFSLPDTDTVSTLHFVHAPGDTLRRSVNRSSSYPAEEHSGTLSGTEVVWSSAADHLITGDLLIPEGTTLHIAAGTLVRLGENATITVRGQLFANGTALQPIAFLPDDSARPWGGLILENAAATFQYCFFSGGGGDNTRAFGHSGSQAIVRATASSVVTTFCFFVYNPGKVFGMDKGQLVCNNTLISHCDTGGEFLGTYALIHRSLVKDIPDGDGIANDDDNDGFYFAGRGTAYPYRSQISNTTITGTEDDCVDHNGASLSIDNCLLEHAYHEGVAASNTDTITVRNTMVLHCEQGIEAGYGSPLVLVDHCLVMNCDVGLRFGDGYDWGATGALRATNSVLYGNGRNVVNADIKTGGPVPGALSTRYSITNTAGYDDSTGCLAAVPVLTPDSLLAENTPGSATGMAGATMGLRPSLNTLVISEFYHDPAAGGSADWIELYNADVLPVDLHSWSFGKDGQRFFSRNVVVPPQSFVVLCRDSSVFRSRYSHPVHLVGNLPFDIGTEGSIVIDFAVGGWWGTFTYSNEAPWPAPLPNGSTVLHDPHTLFYNGAGWRPSGIPGGTPGYYQREVTTDVPGTGVASGSALLRIMPVPFGATGTLHFTVPVAGFVEVLLFSADGRLLQTLVQSSLHGGTHMAPLPTADLPAGTVYAVLRINGITVAFAGGIHLQND